MRHYFFSLLLFASCLVISSCAKDIVDLTGSLSGTIKDYDTGQLISNCRVSLSPTGQSQTSSSDGSFLFSSLEPGDYSLTFVKSGYSDETTTATIMAGKDVTVSVLMKAKSVFSISESVLDFGDFESSKTVYLQNNSDESVSYKLTSIPQWASFSKKEGSVGNASSELLTINVDRSSLTFGEHSQVVTFTYSGKTSGSLPLTLKIKKVELTAPSVSTATTAENITKDSFDIKGTITKTGGAAITHYGHCWSTSQNPTIEGTKTDLGSTDATLSFTSSITGLSVNTTYYVRAYAINQYGTAYGEQVTITTQDVEKNVWDGNIATSFAGGSGTTGDPYLIETGGQLLLAKEYSNKYFKLTANIDLNKHNWLPYAFSGTLDGDGHIISNLYIKREGTGIGLFSRLSGTVKNLKLSGIQLDCTSAQRVGSIAGELSGVISNCVIMFQNDSYIKGNNTVGGAIGYVENSSISKIQVSATSISVSISGGENVGGIIGSNGLTDINDCHVSSVSVYGDSNVGGICGSTPGDKESIMYSSFQGVLSGSYRIGGIVGCGSQSYYFLIGCKTNVEMTVNGGSAWGLSNGIHRACYATGQIKSDNQSISDIYGLMGGSDELSYSAISCSLKSFKDIKSPKNNGNCTSISRTNNIAGFLKECYSAEYAKYWNFDKTWTWTGVLDGKDVSVICPKLAWE